MPRAPTFDRDQFEQAAQVAVTLEAGCYNEPGFVPVHSYPQWCEAEGGEFGMIVKGNKVIRRYFSVD